MAGAVLSGLNTGLDAPMLAFLLQQSEAKIICVDYQYVQIVLKALEVIAAAKAKSPFLVVIRDSDQGAFSTTQEIPPGSMDYDGLLEMGKPDFEIIRPLDECEPITVNYTSGSTGTPKGVVYSHRATYLNSIAQIFRFEMSAAPVFYGPWICSAAAGGVSLGQWRLWEGPISALEISRLKPSSVQYLPTR
ncbi:hypothetical protein Vadar_018158 [Vaccinium darrowii]|uniref:Uncharacterized protein n=1 Tax=Vaccinium darrowii TaxID=229202 RepID=A0ACB7Y7B4_9ERIC|nr:hypothetical protein Vadar_018158 [Vaccinium darrowii]